MSATATLWALHHRKYLDLVDEPYTTESILIWLTQSVLCLQDQQQTWTSASAGSDGSDSGGKSAPPGDVSIWKHFDVDTSQS